MAPDHETYTQGLGLPQVAIPLQGIYYNVLNDPEFLRQKYEVEGLSTNYIAKLAGRSHQGVIAALLRHGIPLRAGRRLSPLMPKGQTPYGYRFAKGLLTEHKGEQAIVRMIVEQREKGSTLRQIVSVLEERRIPTKNGKSWHANTIRKILRQVKVKALARKAR